MRHTRLIGIETVPGWCGVAAPHRVRSGHILFRLGKTMLWFFPPSPSVTQPVRNPKI